MFTFCGMFSFAFPVIPDDHPLVLLSILHSGKRYAYSIAHATQARFLELSLTCFLSFSTAPIHYTLICYHPLPIVSHVIRKSGASPIAGEIVSGDSSTTTTITTLLEACQQFFEKNDEIEIAWMFPVQAAASGHQQGNSVFM